MVWGYTEEQNKVPGLSMVYILEEETLKINHQVSSSSNFLKII